MSQPPPPSADAEPVIEWDVPIEMDDGVTLRADVFRPRGAGRYPVLLSMGPYGKGLTWTAGVYGGQWRSLTEGHPEVLRGSSGRYQSWETADPEKWVPLGYALVRVDSRGAGRSPGFLDVLSPREARDLHDCIGWAGTRAWSTGRVGLAGISYYAINQWQAAALQPPHLAAICPWEGATDPYRDMAFHGGIPCSFQRRWMASQVVPLQHGTGERGARSPHTGEPVSGPDTLPDEELAANRIDPDAVLAGHPTYDEHWAARAVDWSKVTVPILSSANWGGQGLHPRGNFEGFARAASGRKWLEVHGLEHWTHFYTDYGVDLQRRFFDRFLKGEDNGWDAEPAVRLNVRHVDRFEPRAEREWPLARTRWTRLYLDPTGRALSWTAPVGAGAASFAALDEHLTLRTEPFTADTEITGPLSATLHVSSTTSDADLFLVVHLFAPDGAEVTFQGALDPHTPIGQGWLRASHRRLDPALSTPHQPYHPHREVEPLTPGEPYRLDVEIWPTSIVVPAGYRLGLSVRGTDYRYAGRVGDQSEVGELGRVMRGSGPFLHDDPAMRPPVTYGGVTTVHAGPEHRSYLLLPIIPPAG